METNRPSRDRFIDLRVFLALALCSAGLFLATLSLAATSPSGSWSIVPSPNNSAGRTNLLEDVTCITESDCWAVGHYYGTKATQTLIQHWDGKSWSIVPSPNAIANGPNQHNDLTSVACTSSSDCWAVGTHRDNQIPRTLILKWDGKSWSIVPSPDNGPGANYLSDVTCTSANDCWAVGSYAYDQVVFGQVSATMIQRWDGRAWSIVSSPNYTDDSNLLVKEMNNGLASVTCTSASDCWAVGGARGFRQPSRTLIARWNGSTWSLVPSPSTGAENDHGLVSVACASPSDCWAVGSFDESGTGEEPQTLIARWTGTEWSLGPSPDPNGTIGLLGDITCTSSSECWAIGGRSEGSKSLTLIQRWDGTMWSTVPSPNVPDVNQNRLSGLTCASATDCWAVGAALGFDIKTMTQRYTASTNVAPAQLQNISTRLRVQTGDNTLIGGFIVTGSAPKKIILRAIGPSLSAGGSPAAGRMLDPTLELNDSSGARVAFNDNWKDSPQRAEIESSGIPPSNEREAAIARTLLPGAYTATVRGAGDSTGIALVEVYDVDAPADSRLANISTRGFVETGDNVMIGGLIVGPSDRASTKMLVRAVGPSLAARGVAGALQDPTIALHDSNGALLAANDNWKESQQRDIEGSGIPPTDDRESAIVRVLTPGIYTAIVRGKNDSVGVGLIEAYNLGAP